MKHFVVNEHQKSMNIIKRLPPNSVWINEISEIWISKFALYKVCNLDILS